MAHRARGPARHLTGRVRRPFLARRAILPMGSPQAAGGQSGVTIAGRFEAALDDVDEPGLAGPELLPVRLARAAARTLRACKESTCRRVLVVDLGPRQRGEELG